MFTKKIFYIDYTEIVQTLLYLVCCKAAEMKMSSSLMYNIYITNIFYNTIKVLNTVEKKLFDVSNLKDTDL